jgi:ABC-2 type transport system permease protein
VSALVIARKEFQDAIRSRRLIAMTALFTLFYAGLAYLYAIVASVDPQAASALDLVSFLVGPAAILVPIVGLLAGYKSIAGERESGSVKLLLGLPHSRQDVVVGKVLGRAAVVTVSTLVGFLVAAIVAFVRYGSFSAEGFVLFTLLTLVLALAFVSIGVGLSATTGSTNRAVLGVVGIFFLFQFIWGQLPNLLNYVLNGSFGFSQQAPEWAYLVVRLDPQTAYQTVVRNWVIQNPLQQALNQQLFGGDPPVFISPWFALAVLFAWILLPAAVGYLSFERTDL